MPDTKKPRLFIRSSALTDDVSWLCGGPSIREALSGLANTIKAHADNCDPSDDLSALDGDIHLEVRMMSDAEVAAIHDV